MWLWAQLYFCRWSNCRLISTTLAVLHWYNNFTGQWLAAFKGFMKNMKRPLLWTREHLPFLEALVTISRTSVLYNRCAKELNVRVSTLREWTWSCWCREELERHYVKCGDYQSEIPIVHAQAEQRLVVYQACTLVIASQHYQRTCILSFSTNRTHIFVMYIFASKWKTFM